MKTKIKYKYVFDEHLFVKGFTVGALTDEGDIIICLGFVILKFAKVKK